MTATACFAPVQAQSGEVVQLAMQRLWLTGQVLPAGARLTVEHVFRSAEAKPIEVIYAFPLPRDAAKRRRDRGIEDLAREVVVGRGRRRRGRRRRGRW